MQLNSASAIDLANHRLGGLTPEQLGDYCLGLSSLMHSAHKKLLATGVKAFTMPREKLGRGRSGAVLYVLSY
jgi:hypothetical protein